RSRLVLFTSSDSSLKAATGPDGDALCPCLFPFHVPDAQRAFPGALLVAPVSPRAGSPAHSLAATPVAAIAPPSAAVAPASDGAVPPMADPGMRAWAMTGVAAAIAALSAVVAARASDAAALLTDDPGMQASGESAAGTAPRAG